VVVELPFSQVFEETKMSLPSAKKLHEAGVMRSAKLVITLNRSLLENQLNAMLARKLRTPLRFNRKIDCHSAPSKSMQRTLKWLISELEHSHSLLNTTPMVFEQFEQLLARTLLNAQPHNYCRELACKQGRDIPAYVRRVEKYIDENCSAEITMDQLVLISKVSARTLFDGFKRHRKISPMRFLKKTRMEYVHQALKEADPRATSVTDMALFWGFNQLGRFSVEYKKSFGQSPLTTLKSS
jgi:AraC-like DNA-binding protein